MPQLSTIVLAMEFGVNPQEIEEEWDEWWVQRCLLYLAARGQALKIK